MSIGRFFAGISALVWCPSLQKYLLLRRSSSKDFGGGAWECVTGRVDQGEGFTDAVLREINEELGVRAQIDFIVGTMHLYRGETKPENEMVGVQFHCSIEDAEAIKTSAEHSEYRWVTAEEANALLPKGHWLVNATRRAETIRALASVELLDFYRVNMSEV